MDGNLEPYNFMGSLISRQPCTLNLSLRKHKKASERDLQEGIQAELNLVVGEGRGVVMEVTKKRS